jgi:hypothetical protein
MVLRIDIRVSIGVFMSPLALRLECPWALIISLFFGCGPSAVDGLIVAVIVNAINGMLRGRTPAHIGEEGFILVPSLANGNSTASIVMKFW